MRRDTPIPVIWWRPSRLCAEAVTKITGRSYGPDLGCRCKIGSAKMQSQQAAERAERVLQEARKAIEDFETEDSHCRLEAALKIIELSERYGSLKDRMSILMLTDALFRASEDLERLSAS